MKWICSFSHVELGRRGLSNEEETGLRRIYRPDYRDPVEQSEEPELNPADIEEDLRRVQEQDTSMKSVNWNNLRETPVGHLIALFRALEYNQHVTEVNIGEITLGLEVTISMTSCSFQKII